MLFKILIPITGALAKVSNYFEIDKLKNTWQKISIPIIVFAVSLLVFFVLQLPAGCLRTI